MRPKRKRTDPNGTSSSKYDDPKPIIEALKATRGMLTLAADKLGVSRRTLFAYRERWPEIDQEVEEWRERRVDTAEIALDKAVMNGELQAIFFVLNCLGRSRGYGNKVEQTTDATLRVIYGDDGNGQNTDNPASEAARTATEVSFIEGET